MDITKGLVELCNDLISRILLSNCVYTSPALVDWITRPLLDWFGKIRERLVI